MSSRNKRAAVFLFVVLTSLSAVLTCSLSTQAVKNSGATLELRREPAAKSGDVHVFSSEDLSIHFLELGNRYTGDCVYIKYGDIDMIIDAGSKQASAAAIKTYLDNYIQDNKLEYVIATHAHEDHIAGFNSGENVTGILESYEIGLIIDFPNTNSNTVTYRNYLETRGRAVANGASHYTALQCYRNEDGAQRIYDFGGGVQLEVLYNYYYENHTRRENNYSVCVRINQNGTYYLFTGDLERRGERRLVEYYEENYGGLGKCALFKGAHHGSNSSGTELLMAAIKPEYIVVCTCAGSSEYMARPENIFPSQGFIDRAAPYTDKIYITTIVPDYDNNVFMSLNGNVIFLVSQGDISILCSNNDTILKDTRWFRDNRRMPPEWL